MIAESKAPFRGFGGEMVRDNSTAASLWCTVKLLKKSPPHPQPLISYFVVIWILIFKAVSGPRQLK
jgi:hypothetical protein